MERQLSDASLTRSMAPLRRAADGTELDLDLAKLKATEWLEEHDEGASVLYTVPGSKRSQLGVPNVSNDGFGERTPAEKSLHRKGVDQVAAAFAAMADVDLVVRYCDLWRLRNTACEPALAARDLLSTRVDVLAFDGTTPKYAAGIETESNNPAKPQRTVSKLTALTDPLETWLVTPNREHLWTVLRQVDDPAGVSFGAFPNSSAENYAPANWRAFLDSRGILGTNFTDVHTYRSLPNRKLGPESTRQRQKIIGHA